MICNRYSPTNLDLEPRGEANNIFLYGSRVSDYMDGDSYILFGIGLIIGAFLVYFLMRSTIQRKVKDARKESTNTQRSTIKGQITEQLVSLFPEFTEKFEVGDARFLGSPMIL